MSIKTPRLIRDRCGVYYFRFLVPQSWRQIVGKTELRRSLRTTDASTARQLALMLSARMEAFLADTRKKTEQGAELSPDLQSMITDFMGSANHAYKMKVRIFKDGSAEIETDTLDEAREARAIVEAHAKANSSNQAPTALVEQALSNLPVSRCGVLLEKAGSDYVQERTVALSEKGTMPKVRGVLKAFAAHAGNVDLATIDSSTVKGYKQKLLKDGKAGTTINDHLVILTGLFDYCIDNKMVRMDNPARGLLIVGAHNKAESYKPFTLQELGRMFDPGHYLKEMTLPDYYWGPLIALYTGARAEEIASLTLEQIYQEKEVWLIDILKGKTANAVRKVPLHDRLLDLGFVDYCQALREKGYKRVFPHLTDGKNGFKKNMCRAFANYLDTPEVDIKDSLKVFHSFRHTVITKLTSEGVNDGLKKVLVGHDADTRSSAHDDYIHEEALSIVNLRRAINRLEFETVDVSHLVLKPEAFMPAIEKRILSQNKRVQKVKPEASSVPRKRQSTRSSNKA